MTNNLDLVIDTSAVIEIVSGKADPDLRRRLMTANAAAPEVLDAEALSVLRRMVRRAELALPEAEHALRMTIEAPIVRLPHRPLLRRAWEMRDCLGAYDAFYVALAEQLGVPLLTCDGKLARAHGHRAAVELFGTS
jgi:predicted nucleic acid-binding protein